MVKFMTNVAAKHGIKAQKEILTAGGTDTSGIQRMNPGGSIAGAISIPTRHIHQVIEMAHKEDIRGSIDLLTNCLSELDQHDWSF
jgi:putative aminopeptidase FrvX